MQGKKEMQFFCLLMSVSNFSILIFFSLLLKSVGCDLLVDSEKKVDKCGICGGDGTQCQANKVSFVWTEVPLSHCSAPCGGGYRMVRYVCQNNVTNEPVQDELCNVLQKPQPKMASCNVQACPPRYYFQSLYL